MNLHRLEDVAKHNGQNGTKVWVVIQNSVYDLTDYIKEVCDFNIFSDIYRI